MESHDDDNQVWFVCKVEFVNWRTIKELSTKEHSCGLHYPYVVNEAFYHNSFIAVFVLFLL